MGSTSSKQALAEQVSSWGECYQPYAAAILEHNLQLSAQATEDDLMQLLESTLRVTSRLHKRKFSTEFRKHQGGRLLQSASSSLSDGSAQDSASSKSSTGVKDRNSRPTRRIPQRVLSLDGRSDKSRASILRQMSGSSWETDSLSEEFQVLLAEQQAENSTLQHKVDQLRRDSHLERRQRSSSLRSTDGCPLDGEDCTIVLTDVEGSTTLWETAPELMAEALQLHDAIMRRFREKCLGYEMATEGDAFFLAFSQPQDAFRFALSVQHELHEAEWNPDFLDLLVRIGIYKTQGADSRRGLRIRMGISHGKAQTQTNAVTGRVDYYGETKCLARSLEGMACGGQVLTTMDTWQAALHNSEGSFTSFDSFDQDDLTDEEDVYHDARRSNGTYRICQANVETYGEYPLRKSHLCQPQEVEQESSSSSVMVTKEVIEVSPSLLPVMGIEALTIPTMAKTCSSINPSLLEAAKKTLGGKERRPSSGVAPRFPGKQLRQRIICQSPMHAGA